MCSVGRLHGGWHSLAAQSWGPYGPLSWWFTSDLARVRLAQPMFITSYVGRFASFSFLDVETLEVRHVPARRTRASFGERLRVWRRRRG